MQLTVRDARVLNPGHVLPLAVGEPLAAPLAAVAHMRSPARRRLTLTPGTTSGWKIVVAVAAIVFLGLTLTARFGGVSAVEREAYVAEILGKSIIGRPRPPGHALGFASGHVTAGATFLVMVGYLAAKAMRYPHAPGEQRFGRWRRSASSLS